MPRISKWLGIEDLAKAAWEIVTQLKENNKHMAVTNAQLLALEEALKEAATEITTEIGKLKAAIEAGNDPEVDASMGRLTTLGENLRNISPPVEPTPPTP